MSVCRKLPDGTVQKIAGHTILLDANAQEVRTGTATTDSSTTAEMHVWQITFSDPMPDTDYEVMVYFGDESTKYGEVDVRTMWHYTNKTTTGFKASYFSGFTTAGAKTVHYIAWKPVKIEGYTALQNKVNNPDNTPTIDSMNLVTSDGVARAIENASAVWKGTRAEWNALPATTKIKYDLAVITDGGLIKSVDRTTGDSDDVADLTKVWTGTQAEWDAMTQAQKDQWDKAMIQDDYIEYSVLGVLLKKTLTAGQTSVTFTHARITENSFIDVYVSNPNVGYHSITVGTGTCTITFSAQSANMDVGLRVLDNDEWI